MDALDLAASRRTVLGGAGIAALALGSGLALTGCGRDSSQPSGQSGSSGQQDTGPVSVPKSEVAVGSGKVAGSFIVAQPAAGEYRAYSNVCPHQGCVVSLVQEGNAVCPCHGSEFKLTDGSRVAGPAKTGLTAATVEQDGDNLSVHA